MSATAMTATDHPERLHAAALDLLAQLEAEHGHDAVRALARSARADDRDDVDRLLAATAADPTAAARRPTTDPERWRADCRSAAAKVDRAARMLEPYAALAELAADLRRDARAVRAASVWFPSPDLTVVDE